MKIHDNNTLISHFIYATKGPLLAWGEVFEGEAQALVPGSAGAGLYAVHTLQQSHQPTWCHGTLQHPLLCMHDDSPNV